MILCDDVDGMIYNTVINIRHNMENHEVIVNTSESVRDTPNHSIWGDISRDIYWGLSERFRIIIRENLYDGKY